MSKTKIPEELRLRVREAASDCCGYCLCSQRYVNDWLEVEHIIPRALDGTDDEENLWLSCGKCNRHKSTRISFRDPLTQAEAMLFNPRTQRWSEHFYWNEEGTHVIGLTPTGRATILALRLNDELVVEVRRNWVFVGWHPPAT